MWRATLVLFACMNLVTLGCSQSQHSAAPESPSVKTTAASFESMGPSELVDEHGHRPGAHGGLIVSIGADSYHAEIIFEKDGSMRLYTLGRDESRVQEVDIQPLTAFVKTVDSTEATAVAIEPQPQSDDANGKTSQFVAQLPPEFIGKPLEITIPSLRIGDERFRLGFQSREARHVDESMPPKVADAEEVELYLQPGGIYTEADIIANGKQTASQKFDGFMSEHDMHPKAGDKICPITQTKANAKCSWIVGGHSYEFCCPPCVDEFVKMAKQNPESIQDPASYVKR